MSKTPFRMPPRQTAQPNSLDQWVTGSNGTAGTPIDPSRPERAGGKLARLTIDLPPELHARFKATCALKGTRMIDEVRQLIDEWTQKNG